MPEEFKPLFPRSPEDEERRKKLLWETQNKLEKEERSFSDYEECPVCRFRNFGQGNFCRRCGNRMALSEPEAAVFVYGPPPMDFDNANKTDEEIHVTAYGPPPVEFENEREMVLPVYGPPPIEFDNRKTGPQLVPLVYGPPPMPIKTLKKNKLLILIALVFFGLILFGAAAAIITYFLFLR